ncbi:ribosomal RNA-processing protein 7 homolog A [Oratosquilla oratoria]|uniref:ribosomal RNA-processing protein 7 homolog A n=1 Tax=Oratosquilla oratoria TaxID=337810 RepID=UPI003F767C1F
MPVSKVMDVNGFKVLCVKFNERSKICHQILFKQHKVRTQNVQKPPDRTLFLINVPPYCNEACFKRIFSTCGKVVSVFFHKNPSAGVHPEQGFFDETEPVKGFKVAYVVFSHASGIKNALALDLQEEHVLSTEEEPIVMGIDRWYQETRAAMPDPEVLKVEIEKIVAEYDKNQEATKKKNEEPDDGGWITVSNEKKKKPRVEKLNDVEKKRSKKKKKKKQIVNFYSFQEREKKMEHLAVLRKKFEDDKKRIAQMRTLRKFKPY